MPRSSLFDWRGYPKGTFFKFHNRAYAIINKDYVFNLHIKKNVRVTWWDMDEEDVIVLGYLPSEFLK